ncbi:RNA 2',3'-cyclic phosphodiesterase [Aceticella autotrophica]|uniref:RNA 2',3'-cyclic phosphodiesterase n=1 Tax=Aceticella autotrophica TaxID=2755338 RepID=A0A975AUH4_9THEO|nr:RNA 2',3'-cyclic phosphodiesterase [Aceticella autotrophica]QSZ26685.1 RNA 2',3'-cyclic phosphodiesterase [Aceticella autotrophica]
MRTFLALKISDEAVNDIYNLQNELKKYTVKGRWIHKDNFHITIKFFGETNVDDISKIKQAVEKSVINFIPFMIKLSHIGCFKGNNSYRILWIGIEEDKNIISLHNKINEELRKAGFKRDDRKYKAHITIGRDILLTKDIDNINNIFNFNTKPFAISNVYLMESKIENNKREYIPIIAVPFINNKQVD